MPIARLFGRISPHVNHAFKCSVTQHSTRRIVSLVSCYHVSSKTNHHHRRSSIPFVNSYRSISEDTTSRQETLQQAHEASGSAAYKPGEKPEFPGSRSKFVDQLQFIDPEQYEGIPVYRVMNRDGVVLNSGQDPNIDQETLTKMYKGMTLLNFMDRVLYESQRQVTNSL